MEDLNMQAKILVIDDERDFLELMKSHLELEGYQVVSAIDGEDGINKARSENPDLVICDIKMPNKTGHEVLKELREDKKHWIPFIMLSALTDFDNIRQAYDGDSDFYVAKPVQLELLSKNIKTLLNLAKSRTGE